MDSNNNPEYLGSGFQVTKALKKYGKENFSKEILEECSTLQELREREVFWIKKFNASSSDEFYNLIDTKTPCQKGRKRSAKTRQKISEIKKEYFKTHDSPNKGKKMSEEAKKHLSKIKKGTIVSEETRKKLSKAAKGRSCTWGEKISNTKKGISNHKVCKKVSQFDKNGNFIRSFNSITEATLVTGIKTVQHCLVGQCKTAGGYVWKYDN